VWPANTAQKLIFNKPYTSHMANGEVMKEKNHLNGEKKNKKQTPWSESSSELY
jgi:hypothetical protein